MTEQRTKWAMPEFAEIEDACSDENLLRRALIDFTTEFARHIVAGKTTAESISALDSWRNWLATVREHSDDTV